MMMFLNVSILPLVLLFTGWTLSSAAKQDESRATEETCPADTSATCKSGWAYLCTNAKWGDWMLKKCATTCGCNECKADKKIVTPCVCNGKSCLIDSTCEGGTNCYSECKDGVNHKTTCMCKGKTCEVGNLCEECMPECKDGVNHKSACMCKGKTCKVGELCEDCMPECKAGENFRSACLCDGKICEVGNSCEGGKTCTPYLACDNSVVVVPKKETCAAQRKKYCAVSEENTMCKYCGIDTKKCGKAICDFGITDEADIKRIVDSHNKLRRKIAKGLEKGGAKGHEGQPPAANMMKVVWDPEVARMAQTWVDQCSGAHDGNRNMESGYCGQNMAWMGGWRGGEGVPLNLKYTSRAKPMESPANMWYSEVKNYDKDTGKHTGVVGHFTQVVAAGVIRIGCAYLYKDEAKWLGTTITCNYCNGDYSYKGLYTVGEAASKCPSGTKINDGLCELETCKSDEVITEANCLCDKGVCAIGNMCTDGKICTPSDMCTGDYRAPRGTKCDKKCVAKSGDWGKSYCYMDDGSWGAECVKCPETCKSDEVITETNCLCDKVTCAIASTCTDGKTCTLPECNADEKIGIACLCDGKSCPIGNKCEEGKYCYSETCPADTSAKCKSGWAYLCTNENWGDWMLKKCATTCGCNECKADKKTDFACLCNGKSCPIGSSCTGGTNCELILKGNCYNDWPRLLPDYKGSSSDMTPAVCQEKCKEKYAYSGVQNYKECWCGNNAPPLDKKVNMEKCDRMCSGDKNQRCGGGYKNNILKV